MTRPVDTQKQSLGLLSLHSLRAASIIEAYFSIRNSLQKARRPSILLNILILMRCREICLTSRREMYICKHVIRLLSPLITGMMRSQRNHCCNCARNLVQSTCLQQLQFTRVKSPLQFFTIETFERLENMQKGNHCIDVFMEKYLKITQTLLLGQKNVWQAESILWNHCMTPLAQRFICLL